MPVQLKTLLPLLAIFIGLFLIARHFLVPDSFGEYGHYRGNALKEIAALPAGYAGKARCIECHENEAEKLEADLHSQLSCEVCHGPGMHHANDPGHPKTLDKPGSRVFCGKCHNLHPARNIEFVSQVNIKEHHTERGICIECHNPHAVWELKE